MARHGWEKSQLFHREDSTRGGTDQHRPLEAALDEKR
jgi:hypothetical protein